MQSPLFSDPGRLPLKQRRHSLPSSPCLRPKGGGALAGTRAPGGSAVPETAAAVADWNAEHPLPLHRTGAAVRRGRPVLRLCGAVLHPIRRCGFVTATRSCNFLGALLPVARTPYRDHADLVADTRYLSHDVPIKHLLRMMLGMKLSLSLSSCRMSVSVFLI